MKQTKKGIKKIGKAENINTKKSQISKKQKSKQHQDDYNQELIDIEELNQRNHQFPLFTKKSKYVKNILIQFDQFQQLYQDINIENCITSQTNGLNMRRFISLLEKEFNIFTKDKHITFYLEEGRIFLTIPTVKHSLSLFQIQQDDYIPNHTLRIQLYKNRQLIDVVMQDSEVQSQDNADDEQDIDNDEKMMEGKCRRLKQRKIKNVIQKVLKWRQLYAGIENGEENIIDRVPLEEGAKMVKISKKTLDDYLSQLKKGKKYGFNFNDHKNQKIGVLREFIRKVQKKK